MANIAELAAPARNLRDLAHRVIAACDERARAYGLPLPQNVRLEYSLRGRSAAGKCSYSPLTGGIAINLNPDYHAAQGDDYAQTIAHEYAHAVVFEGRRTGRFINPRPHGKEWATVMRCFGYPAERCVSAERARPEPARKVAQYVYACQGCGGHINLGAQRHASAKRGVQYRHRCASSVRTLVFTGTVK